MVVYMWSWEEVRVCEEPQTSSTLKGCDVSFRMLIRDTTHFSL
jgi:hypothetical protein